MTSSDQPPSLTQRAALRAATQDLRSAGIPDAPAQARRLLESALRITPEQALRRDPAAPLSPGDAQLLRALVRRRAAGEPLQHLIGRAPFRGLSLAVGPGAFVPRPETELLVELSLAAAPAAELVIDLGAGTGAIALSVAQARPAAEVVAVERSGAALPWLRENAAARERAGDRAIRIVAADFADPAVADAGGPLGELRGSADLIVANPPYVPAGAAVRIEVRADPADAVFSGADGLDAIRAIAPLALLLLRDGGVLALEHDETHQPQVEAIVRGAAADCARRFQAARRHEDLAGRPRFVVAVAETVAVAESMVR